MDLNCRKNLQFKCKQIGCQPKQKQLTVTGEIEQNLASPSHTNHSVQHTVPVSVGDQQRPTLRWPTCWNYGAVNWQTYLWVGTLSNIKSVSCNLVWSKSVSLKSLCVCKCTDLPQNLHGDPQDLEYLKQSWEGKTKLEDLNYLTSRLPMKPQ